MSSSELFVSKKLEEVWQWKDAIYREVAHLPLDRAIDEILKKAQAIGKEYDFPRRSPLAHKPRPQR